MIYFKRKNTIFVLLGPNLNTSPGEFGASKIKPNEHKENTDERASPYGNVSFYCVPYIKTKISNILDKTGAILSRLEVAQRQDYRIIS